MNADKNKNKNRTAKHAKRTKIFNHKEHEGHEGNQRVESRFTTHGF